MARPKGSAGAEKKHKCIGCYDLRQELKNRHKTIERLKKEVKRQESLLDMAALRIKSYDIELSRTLDAAKK